MGRSRWKAFAPFLRASRLRGDLADGAFVPVVVSPTLPPYDADVVVDARLAKRPLDTTLDDAPLVVGLGPGFAAGANCHAVVETMRGPHLGRVLWRGAAAPNTGVPGVVGGHGSERVLRAPNDGTIRWKAHIGDVVPAGAVIGAVGPAAITAPFAGVVSRPDRRPHPCGPGAKVGDVDPRLDTDVDQISDKALAVGGGVVEAILTWLVASNASCVQQSISSPGWKTQRRGTSVRTRSRAGSTRSGRASCRVGTRARRSTSRRSRSRSSAARARA